MSLLQIPFSVNLKEDGERVAEKFYETFHGTNVNIQVSNLLIVQKDSNGFHLRIGQKKKILMQKICDSIY